MNVPHMRAQPESELPQVFGRYVLIQRLSRGGMGEIFLARHGLSGFEKLVVIKKVLPHLVQDEQFIGRFVDEAQVAIKLQHANVAQVFEVGRVDDEYFLSLEYVEGRDLRRSLAALDAIRENWPVDLALYIGRDLAAGLAYAHRRTDDHGKSLRLVHCDISPPNVMVSFEGEVKIIDFGIAKSVMRGTASDPKIGFGKFGYMAPEQLIRGGVVDHRTDIYAAGVVLFELLTGERLYETGDNPDYRALARMVVKGQHAMPSDCDPELAPYDGLVAKALRPKPEERYQSAAELRDAIQKALVRLNPTVSSDNLGAFMRRLFADDVVEQRQLAARAKATDIQQFVAELTTQSATTISFALAHMPLPAPATEMVERTSIHTPMPFAPLQRAKPRMGLWAALILALLFAAGTLLALLTSGDSSPTTAKASQEKGSEALAAAASDTTNTDSDELNEAKSADADKHSDNKVVHPPPLPKVTPIPVTKPEAKTRPAAKAVVVKKRRRPRVHRRSRRRTTPHTKPKSKLSKAKVHAKFRAVRREYSRFKSKYGTQLERSWSNLVYALQFANNADGLQRLNAKIDHFRSQMRRKSGQ